MAESCTKGPVHKCVCVEVSGPFRKRLSETSVSLKVLLALSGMEGTPVCPSSSAGPDLGDETKTLSDVLAQRLCGLFGEIISLHLK